ncbi:MAG: hypothetical protein D6690_16520 [Nitrospirae bacterium]|nr:MAG: hypothetical protein D6690_16520 [Nitrospirota bacterium]
MSSARLAPLPATLVMVFYPLFPAKAMETRPVLVGFLLEATLFAISKLVFADILRDPLRHAAAPWAARSSFSSSCFIGPRCL